MKAQVTEDDEVLMEAMEQSRYALGDEDFVERIELELAERRLGNIRDQDVDLPVFEVNLNDIDGAVGNHFGIEREVLSDHGGSVGLAKRMAVELARSDPNAMNRMPSSGMQAKYRYIEE